MRNGKLFKGDVTTESYQQLIGDEIVQKGMIGIQPILYHYNVTISKAFYYGGQRTYQFLDLIIRTIKGLFKGNISIKELGGPIMIAKVAGDSASAGMNALLGLMAFLSLNLGLLNILPIPGLDGGHVLIALIEGIIRRDLPIKVKMGVQQVGLLILLMLFITIMVNDIQRLIH